MSGNCFCWNQLCRRCSLLAFCRELFGKHSESANITCDCVDRLTSQWLLLTASDHWTAIVTKRPKKRPKKLAKFSYKFTEFWPHLQFAFVFLGCSFVWKILSQFFVSRTSDVSTSNFYLCLLFLFISVEIRRWVPPNSDRNSNALDRASARGSSAPTRRARTSISHCCRCRRSSTMCWNASAGRRWFACNDCRRSTDWNARCSSSANTSTPVDR